VGLAAHRHRFLPLVFVTGCCCNNFFFFEIHPLWARPFDGFTLVFSLDCDVLCVGVGALALCWC
jgi:hypothetical protein